MALGKTIQIFLPDGDPRGIKIAEITSRTVQALLIPRFLIDAAGSRQELSTVGVYFLVGSPDEEAKPLLYVGEAEDCLVRLKQHNKTKDFWTAALVLVSKTKYFTKSHIKFLEWHCLEAARDAARYRLENSTIPTRPYIPESVEADLLDNFDTIKILLGTLGYPLFERVAKKKTDILICKGKDAYAEGQYTSEGLVVFAGSTCNLKETRAAGSWVRNIRQRLIDEGTLESDGKIYKFVSDQVFSSPSGAAAAVLARHASGWLEWKFKDGRTLDEVVRQHGSK